MLKNSSSRYLEEAEKELGHKSEIMTVLNRFLQYASETTIEDRDWQGIPSSTGLPSGLGETTAFLRTDSYGGFKEETDPFANL